MKRYSLKLIVGVALVVLGIWRLIGGGAASPTLLPGWPGTAIAVAALALGFWLYRSARGT